MKPRLISSLLEARMGLILEGFDPLSAGGFTQVPNIILEHKKLTPGAKLTYAMLLRYAWEKNRCFPGQQTLATEMGVVKKSVIKYLKELSKSGYLESKRRGQGKTNIYILRCRIKQKCKKVTSKSVKTTHK